MKVKTLVEIQSAKGIIPAGQIIEITPAAMDKLNGKVEPLTNGRGLPHYCKTGACWCSALLPGRDYPADCIRIRCEYKD